MGKQRSRGRQEYLVQERREDIGRRIKFTREARGLTQRELAARVGCGKSHISQIESASGSCSLKMFIAVCDALTADPAFIFANVSGHRMDELHKSLERGLAIIGPTASDVVGGMTPKEIRLGVARGVEAVQYRRMREGRLKPRSS